MRRSILIDRFCTLVCIWKSRSFAAVLHILPLIKFVIIAHALILITHASLIITHVLLIITHASLIVTRVSLIITHALFPQTAEKQDEVWVLIGK